MATFIHMNWPHDGLQRREEVRAHDRYAIWQATTSETVSGSIGDPEGCRRSSPHPQPYPTHREPQPAHPIDANNHHHRAGHGRHP